MKTKLYSRNRNLVEFNYDVKLNKGLYYTLSPKYLKLNCRNYSIKPKDEITISTIEQFSIITIEVIGRTKIQYLVTIEFDEKNLEFIPKRNLPEDFIQYISMAKESISLYKDYFL